MKTLLCLLLVLANASCAGWRRWPWGSTQEYPGPMENDVEPLPPGDAERLPPGPEEVLVLRHADPVQVRPAGLTASFPLSFYSKSLRVNSGASVVSAPGGRAEVLWPGGNSLLLFGRTTGRVGSVSRGEPSFVFRQIERAQLEFKTEEQVELVGGARLTVGTGPFVIEHVRNGILRVKNQSKGAGTIAYREGLLTLDPGEVVDLPLLAAGGSPLQSDPGLKEVREGAVFVRWSGQVELTPEAGGLRARALGEHQISGLGLALRMDRGEQALFLPHAMREDAAAPAPAPAPTPKP